MSGTVRVFSGTVIAGATTTLELINSEKGR